MAKAKAAPRTPEKVVKDLAPAYKEWKEGEKGKNKFKDEFFAAITLFHTKEGEQAEEIVTITDIEAEDMAQTWVEKQYPAWEVTDSRENPEGDGYQFIIREMPEYMPYTIEYDGKVWGRQIAAGSTFIDDERIQEEDPNLWREISVYPNEKEVREIIAFALGKDDNPDNGTEIYEVLEAFSEQRREGRRNMKPLAELNPDQLAKVQKYAYEGKPTIKLPAPKKAESDS